MAFRTTLQFLSCKLITQIKAKILDGLISFLEEPVYVNPQAYTLICISIIFIGFIRNIE